MATPSQHGNVNPLSRVGVYPGSFNPPTIAHLEIAVAARDHHRLDRLDLTISVRALGKDSVTGPSLDHRLLVVEESVADLDGVEVVLTEAQLIADIACDYDVVVMGADKWAQVHDVAWYDSANAMTEALARLPVLAVAPRSPHVVPEALLLPVRADLLDVSSSAVRAGRIEWMTPAAAAFDKRTGAWTDPGRYQRGPA